MFLLALLCVCPSALHPSAHRSHIDHTSITHPTAHPSVHCSHIDLTSVASFQRIVLLVGAGAIPPRRVVLQVSGEAEARELEFSLQRNRLIVRKPDVNILADFTITFE
jgi:hypothetical protein